MSRIDGGFDRLRAGGGPGLVTYVTAGDPDADRSVEILLALAAAGADVLEVGVPFSDPLADGPVIQRASERALARGMTLRGALDVVRRVRRVEARVPIVLFTYANPVVRRGLARFAAEASDAGVDGVLVLDFPIEEAMPLQHALLEAGLDPIFLVSPTTTDRRIQRSGEMGRGFLYVISRLGVTGARERLGDDVGPLVNRVRAATALPVAVGFGISTPQHVARACEWADAAVVGSALVRLIGEHQDAPDLADRVAAFASWLKGT